MQNYDITTLFAVLSSSAIGIFILFLAILTLLLPLIWFGTYRSNRRQEELLERIHNMLRTPD